MLLFGVMLFIIRFKKLKMKQKLKQFKNQGIAKL